jgi:polyhydroxyalkanoate depolymerase
MTRLRNKPRIEPHIGPGTGPSKQPLKKPRRPGQEHSVPWFWPFAAAIEMEEDGLRLFRDNLRFLEAVEEIAEPPAPGWATANRVLLDLDTMRLRDFAAAGSQATPVLVDAPYAGHSATIADYDKGQSLVETLLRAGLERVLVTDWKSATDSMKDFDIDKYLAEINAAVDDLGGSVHLVGLCQGGWMSAMYAARFPGKVRSLVLAGAPIDTEAGSGPIKKIAHRLPMGFYQELVAAGGGRMLGRVMLAGWKDMHPEKQYVEKYIDLYEHIEDKCYVKRTERFERWYESPIDLPGRYYLQAIKDLFKENRLAKGLFVGLGRKLDLKDIRCPLYLLAGEADDITTHEQMFDAEKLVSTPPRDIVKKLAPGGHIGLFMGSHTLRDVWPGIGRWIKEHDTGRIARAG